MGISFEDFIIIFHLLKAVLISYKKQMIHEYNLITLPHSSRKFAFVFINSILNFIQVNSNTFNI